MVYIRMIEHQVLMRVDKNGDMCVASSNDATSFAFLTDAQAAIYRFVKKTVSLDVRNFEVVEKAQSITYKVVG